MQTFLSYVAEDMLKNYGENLADITVVFPNKRASLFLNQALARLSDRPVWSPSYVTISDLFRQYSQLTIADPIQAVVELHKSFTKVTGRDESLDQFFGWGQLLLADFDDIDKNEADAGKVFGNVRDWHEYDDVSFLTPEQKALLKSFFKNFEGDDSILKRRFRELWSHLYDVYVDYHEHLIRQGLAYEGMLYRDALKDENMVFPAEKYLFVGFNMLHKVEQSLFKRLQQQGKAAFYWDYDRHYTQLSPCSVAPCPLPLGEAGVYISQYLDRFPNALPADREDIFDNLGKGKKDITYISALTEDIQARYITDWLRANGRIKAGNKTAIVMCDENLLHTAIHCIPSEVGELNVTTGFPLRLTPVASLIAQLIAMQWDGYAIRKQSFRLHYVNRVLRHPYAPLIYDGATDLGKALNAAKRYYVEPKQLPEDDGLALLFTPIGTDENPNQALLAWLLKLIRLMASHSPEESEPLFQESLFRMYTLLNRLHDLVASGQLTVSTITMQRFISQAVSSTTIPFHGEPAVGIQLMGVLETRNLDFDHVLILSCNEGNMPKGVNDASFIPHAIRRAYELTTVDNKVAIYSYYFHRLLQRCKDITIVYNKSTEGVSTGEMSQFMLQMLVELPHPVRRITLQAGQKPLHHKPSPASKSEEVLHQLSGYTNKVAEPRRLSPTAINTYLRCQLRFYYKYVAHIREQDEQDEDIIDNRIFGNIFHRAAELMYEQLLPKDVITEEDIEWILKKKDSLEPIVAQAINEKLFNETSNLRKMPALNGLQLINKEVIETYLRQLLRLDSRLAPFQVIGHEHEVGTEISLDDGTKVSIGGVIDRLDAVNTPQGGKVLRVVDYKTGRQPSGVVKTVEDIFDPLRIESAHSDYILQAMLYAIIVAGKPRLSLGRAVSPALLYIQQSREDHYDPTICIGNEPVSDAARQYETDFMEHLKGVLRDIFNPELSFNPTTKGERCTTCPYRNLCFR